MIQKCHLPQEMINEILSYNTQGLMEMRSVCKNWKNACEERIIQILREAFDLDFEYVSLQSQNAKNMGNVYIGQETYNKYNSMKNLFDTFDYDEFSFNDVLGELNRMSIQMNFKYNCRSIQSHRMILNIMKDETVSFMEKIKKVNILFFENIFDFDNIDYFVNRLKSNMFYFRLLIQVDRSKCMGFSLELSEYDDSKIESLIQNLERISIFSFDYVSSTQPKDFKFKFKLEEKNVDCNPSSDYNDMICKKSSNPLTNPVCIQFGCSIIDVNPLIEKQIKMTKCMNCFDREYLQKYENIIRLLKKTN